jgi:hypothetical protein
MRAMPRAPRTLLAARRLIAQQIARHELTSPGELVAWLGAVQAQDYAGAKWALGLRLGAATEAAIERALSDGAVLRTHALRGTWQLVAPADLRWILALVGPQVIARCARRYEELDLDASTLRRSNDVLAKTVRSAGPSTREELAAALERRGISAAGQRLAYLLQRAELDALICSGARRGKRSTYALVDDRAPEGARALTRDEALAALAGRYFRSRGPATVDDFAWWSGLPAAEARAGLGAIESTLAGEAIDGATYWSDAAAAAVSPARHAVLLPAFDEYLVAYRRRDAVLDPAHAGRMNAGGGMLDPCVVLGGRVVGTWRRVLGRDAVTIDVAPFAALSGQEARAIPGAARAYGEYMGLPCSFSTTATRPAPPLPSPRRRARRPARRP